jgi:hypothetical protein
MIVEAKNPDTSDKSTISGFARHFLGKALAELDRFDKNSVSEGWENS